MKTLHQFGETLAAEAKRDRRPAPMSGSTRQRRANEPLFELQARVFERFSRRMLDG